MNLSAGYRSNLVGEGVLTGRMRGINKQVKQMLIFFIAPHSSASQTPSPTRGGKTQPIDLSRLNSHCISYCFVLSTYWIASPYKKYFVSQ
jgi:hypothetical protein